MAKINFTKMVASGNDFILLDSPAYGGLTRRIPVLAHKLCDRKFGIGADGLLVLEKAKAADIRMRIFNADGSEAEMCGNGARCVALYVFTSLRAAKRRSNPKKEIASVAALPRNDSHTTIKIETKAGIIESEVNGDNVRIKLTDPTDIKLDIPVKINNRKIKVDYIDTGVPHAVVFVEGLDKINVAQIGRAIRNHKVFAPRGANVNFVEPVNDGSISARTYERGVEAETLACGTGSVASALIFALRNKSKGKINVRTRGKEVQKVYFEMINNGFEDVWLEGKARIVYTGVYNV